ncbi:MAG: transaminase [Pseudomonadota bacterium]|nr:transaminase [Pseudomonadota bacterium]
MARVDRDRLATMMASEELRFTADHPKSAALFERTRKSVHRGVPMPWMTQWASPFPIFADSARGARIRDVDGHDYIDFSLGDTGALFGHSAAPIAEAVADQAGRGITHMLPTEDAARVGEALTARFGLPNWQFALSATDANRFAIRLARLVTGRRRILVFNGCYHGSLDETLVSLENGVMRPMATTMGAALDPAETTRMVEFNDVAALEAALAEGDVACVLCEPALTNVGLVFPAPGFHQAVRDLSRKHGAMLVVDETHTICAGPGGGTGYFGLDPDIITLGKPLAGGIAGAVYGFSEAIGERVADWIDEIGSFVTGIGGTLSGNALAMRAMAASLENVMTDEAYAHMTEQATRLADGVSDIIAARDLDWGIGRLGARIEYRFHGREPANATEAQAGDDPDLDRLFRLYFLNRGILLTIFYNVSLVSPETSAADIDRHNDLFAKFAGAVTA